MILTISKKHIKFSQARRLRYKVDVSPVEVSRVKGHNLKIRGQFFRNEMRRIFFTKKIANLSNSLPKRAVQ